jgi:hypothetical protein
MRRLEANDLQLVVTLARQIWLHRNFLIFNGEFLTPALLLQRTKDQVEERIFTKLRDATVWQKPPVGKIKINWDAAVDCLNNKMGMEVIARDHNGSAVVMLCASKEFISDPAMAEAVAAWRTVELACSLDLESIMLEGDSLEVVQALKKNGSCWSSYGQVVNEMKMLLEHFQVWEVNHVRRVANNAAHCLAKLALVQVRREYGDTIFLHA